MGEGLRVLRLSELGGLQEAVKVLRPQWSSDSKVEEIVSKIVEDVAARGDQAIIEYEEKFDSVSMKSEQLRVPPEEFDRARTEVPSNEARAMRYLHRRVCSVEKDLLLKLKRRVQLPGGGSIRTLAKPIGSVGCYVPGGRAVYPSSLIMALAPAEVAGVKRRIVCTPPTKEGKVPLPILVAAEICGVNEVYMVGGAQAIAAMAYGTATIPEVEKVVGPGGSYVTIAKMVVSRRVGIDLPAGPSELLVLADEGADPEIIAMDLISQAEHSEDCTCGLVTDSEKLAFRVRETLADVLQSAPRRNIASRALLERGFALVCRGLDEAAEFTGAFAPEHLEIMTVKPRDLVERIDSAGLILLGKESSVASTDYAVGTNHILPTGGYAKIYSGLSSLDFVKMVNVVKCTKRSLRRTASTIRTLSSSEDLPNHWRAIEKRLGR